MAEIALVNATVWTGNPRQPRAEAVAVRGDRILAVGSTAEIKERMSADARVIDAAQALVLPGFIDCHTHFINGGFSLQNVRLRDATSRQEFARRLAQKARELGKGKWVLNGGWDHEQFSPPELPRKEWIDAVTPDNPVFVSRLDGHIALANSVALHIAGITRETPVPPGGEIVIDLVSGEPTGILKDAAMRLVYRHVPEPSANERETAAALALKHAAAHGLTSVHDMSDMFCYETYRRLSSEGRLTCRLAVYLPITGLDKSEGVEKMPSHDSDFLKLAGLKGFMDGSLGAATAYFFEPYSDNPRTSGLLHDQMFPDGIMQERVRKADRLGLQVAVHAIGDRANSLLLDIYGTAISAGAARDRRWRIEHAQHLRPADITRMEKLGIVASMQPYHAVDDGCWAEKKLGKARLQTTYAFRSMLDSGVRLAFGSDWPVAPLDPLAGIYAAVTRRTADGKNPDGWIPEQKITVEEAVGAYTTGAAFTEFEESTKGTIEAGKLADLVVLERDIFRIPPEQIRETRVLTTVAGGRLVYER